MKLCVNVTLHLTEDLLIKSFVPKSCLSYYGRAQKSINFIHLWTTV